LESSRGDHPSPRLVQRTRRSGPSGGTEVADPAKPGRRDSTAPLRGVSRRELLPATRQQEPARAGFTSARAGRGLGGEHDPVFLPRQRGRERWTLSRPLSGSFGVDDEASRRRRGSTAPLRGVSRHRVPDRIPGRASDGIHSRSERGVWGCDRSTPSTTRRGKDE